MRPRVLRRRLLLAGLGGVLAAATLGTGVAKADPAEDFAFLAALDYFGVSVADEAEAIDIAHSICGALDNGLSPTTVARMGMDHGATRYEAEVIVGVSVGAYCNEYLDALPTGKAGRR